MKIIPYGMAFERALVLGYAGRIECPQYLVWLRTLPCDTCGASAPSQASHLDNSGKGLGSKNPDPWSIPECDRCHRIYERLGEARHSAEYRKARAALYMLQAFVEGRLVWKP